MITHIPTIGKSNIRRDSKTITFTGGAGLGAVGVGTVYTVTGEILIVTLVPTCTVDAGVDAGTGVASMQLGVTNVTTLFIASTTATAIDANEIWVTNTPNANGIAVPAALKDIAITQNIEFEVTSTGAQLVNAGAIRFDLLWRPLSANGAVS